MFKLTKRASFMHSSFGNDKESQSIHDQNKHYKNIFLEFNRRHVYILESQMAYDNIFFKKSILHYLINLMVKTQNLSQWSANRIILIRNSLSGLRAV